MEYIRSAHSVYLLTYHIVFVTKYRKPVINDEISEFLKNHIGYLCTRFDAELLTAETDRDHIHMLISMPPKVAPADLIRVLKTQTAREIHQDPQMDAHVKKYIYWDAPLWQPSYFVATTGTTVMEKVREYIDSQQTEEHRRKYEKTGRYSKNRRR
jgi:putative transposase